jgi:S1-C subfamily serine protease
MNFSGTLIKLLLGSAIASTLAVTSSIAFTIPETKNRLIAQITAALPPEQVNLRAKQITVRIDGASTGSGSIIGNSGNTYTVLSNWHVMKNPGEYILQTVDGIQHTVEPNSIKQLPGLDLAILKFESDRNYQVAEIGDSGNAIEGQSIYFAGYPGELRREDNRYYRFFAANIVGILPQSTENGYSLVYNGEAFPGMSGGPVLDRSGLLIGIHGEANIQALTGGVSNYAIPINSYKQAIARVETSPTTAATPPENTEPPEVTVDVTVAEEKPPAANSQANTPNGNTIESNNITSVPTFENSNNTNNNTENTSAPSPPATVNPKPANTPPESANSNDANDNQNNSEIFNQPLAVEPDNPQPQSTPIVPRPQPITLVSQATGIDYSSLRDLLKAKKWEEADLQTYQLIDRIIKTAKNQNQNMFIELKTIAEFSCNDIRTIDTLWKKYSDNKFGFSPQQKVWRTVNQDGDFSTQTWRQFATQVGWKTGDVNSSSGYLLYEELNFNPGLAPVGHLPWWFALPEEQQNVIKHLFARCDFNPQPRQAQPTTENRVNSNAATSEGAAAKPQ